MMGELKILRHWSRWAGGLLVVIVPHAAQAAQPRVEPQWFRFRLSDVALSLDFESNVQSRSSPLAAAADISERFYLRPGFEFRLSGSVYHPNLLEFDLFGANSLGFERDKLTTPGRGVDNPTVVENNALLVRYNFSASLLKERPYASRVHASKGRSTRTLDFFTSTRVDSESYGAGTGYRAGPIPIDIGYNHISEVESGLSQAYSREESTFTFRAQNNRGADSQTEFNYTAATFDRTYFGLSRDTGSNRLATLTDTEQFGSSKQARLQSWASYSQGESTLRDDEDFQGTVSLDVEHTDAFNSSVRYAYNKRSSGFSDNDGQSVSAGIRHQWYESLSSSLELTGSRESTASPVGSLDLERKGVTWTENYQKRLTPRSRLSLGYSLRIQPEDRTFKGEGFEILDETHDLSDGTISLLAVPNIKPGTVRVSDATGTITYVEGLDYTLQQRGAFTELRRVPGGRIADKQTVLVNYTAEPQPSGSFTSTSNSFTWRIDLRDRLLSIYGRFSKSERSGDAAVIFNDYRGHLVGVESDMEWLQIGAEYENYDSNQTPFEAIRLRQSLIWKPRETLSCSLNLSETRTDYRDPDRTVDYLDLIARAEFTPSATLRCSIEGGYRTQSGDQIDQTMLTARVSLDYTLGRLSVKAGYDYQSVSFFANDSLRNYFYLHARRTF